MASPEIKNRCETANIQHNVKRYYQNDYRLKFAEMRRPQLQTNLWLLKQVMWDIRRSLLNKEKNLSTELTQQEKYIVRSILVCDEVNNIYKRKCPTCPKELTYSSMANMMNGGRKGATCYSCMGKKVGKRQSHLTTEKRRVLSIKSKSRWNSYSKEKQDRIKQAGRDSTIIKFK